MITSDQEARLTKSLEKFGDLSGIVVNRRTGLLIGGHQRRRQIPSESTITVERTHDPPTRTGTVAEGFIDVDGERFAYREVDWDEAMAKAANIAANQHGGEFKWDELGLLIQQLAFEKIDMDLLGFDSWDLDVLLAAEWTPVAVTNDSFSRDQHVPAVPLVSLTAEQLAVIERACQRLRETKGDATMTIGVCIELICVDWMG